MAFCSCSKKKKKKVYKLSIPMEVLLKKYRFTESELIELNNRFYRRLIFNKNFCRFNRLS